MTSCYTHSLVASTVMEFLWQLIGGDIEAHTQTLDKDRTQVGNLWIATTFEVLETPEDGGERIIRIETPGKLGPQNQL